MGGIFAEVLRDVASAPAPLDTGHAKHLIGRLNGLPLLQGARGRPPADIDALAYFVARLSQLAIDCRGRVRAFDVNPLHVYERGRGIAIIDAAAELF